MSEQFLHHLLLYSKQVYSLNTISEHATLKHKIACWYCNIGLMLRNNIIYNYLLLFRKFMVNTPDVLHRRKCLHKSTR